MSASLPVIWLTGLSGSGKTTIAKGLSKRLQQQGLRTAHLDGDTLREGLNNDLGFSDDDRMENVRRAAHVARIMRNGGAVVICSLISPLASMRQLARAIIGEGFIEVYVNCPIEVCMQRDVKGLYAKATAGHIDDFTGVGSEYEPPVSADLEVRTDQLDVSECVAGIISVMANVAE